MLELQERRRYSRQILLPEMGLARQEKLKAARILVIGAGGLGCPALQYLTAAGVGTIGIADDDVVEITNLHRQILYSTEDIGKGKAQTAKDKLSALNPFVKFDVLDVRISNRNASQILAGFDIVIDGSDNFPTRYLISDTCVALGKPLVFGSILRFEGQVSVFNYKSGPSYRDLFPDVDEGDNCAEAGVMGILPGIIGTYMANEAIKIICEIGEVLSGKLLAINALTNETNIFQFGNIPEITIPYTNENPVFPTSEDLTSKEILFDEFEKLQQSDPDHTLLVDVREEYEFEEDYIGGINTPLPDLLENLTKMPADKTIVFYCRSGIRSQKAVDLLKKDLLQRKSYWMKEN